MGDTYDSSDAIFELLIQKMREMDAEYFRRHDTHISFVDPRDVQSTNEIARYLKELFESQDTEIEFDYGGNLGSKANVQVYIDDVGLCGGCIKSLSTLMRMCKSVNFTSMKSGKVMIQFWVK